jgi:FAD/FMN-containing dehydrogenase
MSLLDELRAALGEAAVREGPEMGARPGSDMSLTGTSQPRALIRPRNTQEVSTALKLCNEAGVPVIAQGGMTGLAGGANPTGNEIAISLELLRGIEELDTAMAQLGASRIADLRPDLFFQPLSARAARQGGIR